jgi:hypothetical protein
LLDFDTNHLGIETRRQEAQEKDAHQCNMNRVP